MSPAGSFALLVLDISPEALPDMEHLKERLAFHEQELTQMAESGQSQILYTDPDARVMKTKDGGKRACYNVQSAVDPDSHMVVALDVGSQANDKNLLASTVQLAKQNLHSDCIAAIADKGYGSAKDIQTCFENGIIPDVGFSFDKEHRVFVLDYLEAKITPQLLASQKPARVILTIRKDIQKQKKRMQASEHPFGTVKHYDGASWFLCRGRDKVTALRYPSLSSATISAASSPFAAVCRISSSVSKGYLCPFLENSTGFQQFRPESRAAAPLFDKVQ